MQRIKGIIKHFRQLSALASIIIIDENKCKKAAQFQFGRLKINADRKCRPMRKSKHIVQYRAKINDNTSRSRLQPENFSEKVKRNDQKNSHDHIVSF